MAMFKIVAATQLKMVLMVFLMGSSFRAVPASPDNACGWDFYTGVVLAHHSLVLIAASAAMLLFMVWSDLRIAEAAAARAAEKATARRRAFGADRDAIRSVAPGLWLRGELLVAVLFSFAASFLAVVTFLDGSLYRTGCHAGVAGYGSGSLMGMLFVGLFALVHGFFAWAAVTQN